MDYQEIRHWQKIPQLKKLLDLTTPPKKLFYLGKFNPDIFESCTGVVGSRRMSSYGERVIEKIIPQLITQGQTIVSGFMYGVDQAAHRAAVEGGGKTIAVLGWGIDQKLTGQDLKLAQQIIDQRGLLLSEWETQPATLWTFPARNRIVAALSEEIIVVEAAEKSGSLITARSARKLKKTLWAVPGPITSRLSSGTNNLIAAGLAQMWLGNNVQVSLIKSDDPIIDLLLNESLTADEIARNLKRPVAEIGAELSLLLLSGQVMEKEGKYYLNDAS